jgi:glutaminyl-peptide cyclotransferase
MRTFLLFFTLLFTSSFVFVNCVQSSKRSRKPVTSIQISPKHKNYRLGDRLTVGLQTKLKDGALKKIELFLDGKSIFVSDKIDCSYEIESKNLEVGTHVLKTVATKEDGVNGENYVDFLLLSDLVPENLNYKVIRSFPHNVNYFTEGFEIYNGFLYEGTGQEGSSAIYKTDLKSWKVVKEFNIEKQYFGEGITIFKDQLYQLTYKTQIGFVRDLKTFEVISTWNYKNAQGWGMTNDGNSLIMSDGTEYIYYLDPDNLTVIKRIQVCNHKETVTNINELEYINGEIWANIWMTDTIVKIDPKSGKILAEINLKGLLESSLSNQKTAVDVLNGIAYDKLTNKIYVTGKLWPKTFEIQVYKSLK